MKNESNIKFIVKEIYKMISDGVSSHILDMKTQYKRRMTELKEKRRLIDSLSEDQAIKVYTHNISDKVVRYDFDYSNNKQVSRPLTLREIKRKLWNKVKLSDIKSSLGGKV